MKNQKNIDTVTKYVTDYFEKRNKISYQIKNLKEQLKVIDEDYLEGLKEIELEDEEGVNNEATDFIKGALFGLMERNN